MPVTQAYIDAIESHAARLSGLDDAMVRKVLAVLHDLEGELKDALLLNSPAGIVKQTARLARLSKLLDQTDASIAAAYAQIGEKVDGHLVDIAGEEIAYREANLEALLKPLSEFVSVNSVTVSPEILEQLASNTVVTMGDATGAAPFREWLAKQESDLQLKYAGQIMRGIQIGEGTDEMVRRVVGSKTRDGIMEIPRYQAEALVRTSTQAVMGEARRKVYKANGDVVKGIVQITTRDERTSVVCLAYAGNRWTIEDDGTFTPDGDSLPYNGGVPRHPGCRSTESPWVKSLEEMGIDPEDVPKWADNIFDGESPAGLDGESIIEDGGAGYADAVLGPGRAAMVEAGDISLQDLVNPDGTVRTLEELRALPADRVRSIAEPALSPPEALPEGARLRKEFAAIEDSSGVKALDRQIADSVAESTRLKGVVSDLTAALNSSPGNFDLAADFSAAKADSLAEWKRQAALRAQQAPLAEAARQQAFGALQVETPTFYPAIRWGEAGSAVKDQAREGLDWLRSVMGREIPAAGNNAALEIGEVSGRAYQVDQSVFLNATNGPAVAIHEMGHWLEQNPEFLAESKAFLESRTAGEEVAQIDSLATGLGYRSDEVVKPDKFANPYTGKIYENAAGRVTATEILSMGLENMFRDPIGFAKEDPGFFDFVVNFLKGGES